MVENCKNEDLGKRGEGTSENIVVPSMSRNHMSSYKTSKLITHNFIKN